MANKKFIVSTPVSKTMIYIHKQLEPTEEFENVCYNLKRLKLSCKYATNGHMVYFVYENAEDAINAYRVIANDFGSCSTTIGILEEEDTKNDK